MKQVAGSKSSKQFYMNFPKLAILSGKSNGRDDKGELSYIKMDFDS
jgi:hypothetical protein